MTGFPRSPRLAKGALVSVEKLRAPLAIVFQYNPESISRSLAPQWGALGSGGEDAIRLHGPAAQTIDMEVLLDATDRLEENDAVTRRLGLAPQLAALETLVNPSTARVLANAALERTGTIEILPPAGALTILIWGSRRIVPVRLESLSITEEAHDQQLNPIRARASLGLQVLTWSDFESTHPGFWLSLAHQGLQEALAVTATVSELTDLLPAKLQAPAP